ncbi:MAG: class I fructose-bisphosphate aldolase family protein [Candidatus Methanomethyliaceae archaeon]|nr:class I fructose-bisphosphate aldolase family protein [Candidatus Methanomethyliaceae archaeon]
MTDSFSSVGKKVRLSRILRGGRAVIFAFDHGFEHGPSDFPEGRESPKTIIDLAVKAGFDALMTTKGVARATKDLWAGKIPLILKVTGKTSIRPPEQRFLQYSIGSVEEAFAMGADGVAATVYWGSPHEEAMAEQFSSIVSVCDRVGMPVMILSYPRGPGMSDWYNVETVRYACRASAELGADLIKTYYTGSAEAFKKVVEVSPVPVLMSGGTKAKEEIDFLKAVENVMSAGGAGVVVGRNLFQSQNFIGLARAVISIVHGGLKAEDALKLAKE